MKFCFVLDFEGKDMHYFDTMFSKNNKIITFFYQISKNPNI